MGLKYEPALDGLRGVAILAVVLYHSQVPGFWGGAIGVDLFFVLSGYLITSKLRDEAASDGIDYRAFWAGRMRRLYPALLALVAVTLSLPDLFPDTRLVDAARVLTYSNNLAPHFGGAFIHLWSLALEAQFYLALPLVLPLALRFRYPAALFIALWAILTGVRYGLLGAGVPFDAIYYGPLHASGLALGVAVALLPPLPPLIARVGLLVFIFTAMGAHGGIFATVAEIAAAATVGGLRSPSWLNSALSVAPMVWIGRLSYGLYLWHLPLLLRIAEEPPGLKLAVALGGGLVLATISYFTVERWGRQSFRPLPDPARVI